MGKYLIIAMDLEDSAAGIVFKNLMRGMQDYSEFDVLCPNVDNEARQICEILPCTQYWKLHYRLRNLYYKGLGYLLIDRLWAFVNLRRTINGISKNSYDAIISFVYGGNTAPIVLGNLIKKKANLPWIVYSVDAIPTPIAWTNDSKQFSVLFDHLNGYLSIADALFWANPVMKEYEKGLFENYSSKFGVVLTPGGGNATKYDDVNGNKSVIFLYAGQIYGPRKIDALLDGFTSFLKYNPSAKLIFVGNCNVADFIKYTDLLETGNLEVHPFSNDIQSYYQLADVLIDINADIENDVFLSSKICNYIFFDKPIVAISQDGSPVRVMMGGYDSIIHCHHNSEEILAALKEVVSNLQHYKDDREDLRKIFSASTIARDFCCEIEAILKHNA